VPVGNIVPATIAEMERTDGTAAIWRQGRRLMDGLDRITRTHGVDARCVGQPRMPRLKLGDVPEALSDEFYTDTADRGICFNRGHCRFVSPAQKDEVVDYPL